MGSDQGFLAAARTGDRRHPRRHRHLHRRRPVHDPQREVKIRSSETHMTYDEYIAQEQQAMDEEQRDDSCFLEYQPEGQFVRGH